MKPAIFGPLSALAIRLYSSYESDSKPIGDLRDHFVGWSPDCSLLSGCSADMGFH